MAIHHRLGGLALMMLASPALAQATSASPPVAQSYNSWFWPVIGVALIVGGVLLFLKGRQMQGEVDRYEFENRTDGGVVRFPDYEHSRRHEIKRGNTRSAQVFGQLAVLWGIGMVAFYVVFPH